MKLAILGGSFNPIHVGHLLLADSVISELDYDRVMFIPAHQSPFKPQSQQDGNAKDRLDMLLASISGDSRFIFEDTELKRKGISYTIDTIRHIINKYGPHGKPALILGDDLLEDFPKWKNAQELSELVDLVIARRNFEEIAFPFNHKKISNNIVKISSSDIREKIQNHGAWRSLVPQGACSIIEERLLYGYTPKYKEGAISKSLLIEVENAVHKSVSIPRFAHSRNVALLSWDLCLLYNIDPSYGYLAGIAHDICKPLNDEDMLELVKRDGLELSKQERKKPSLLHGRAAAVLLAEKFKITDVNILEAVRLHTIGGMTMSPLAKIVYIADKIEVSREDVDHSLRKLVGATDLDTLFVSVLNETIAYLKSQETDISDGTLRLLDAIHKKDRVL